MLKKAGFIALPLIVLAGMRRCPQRPMVYNMVGQVDGQVLTASLAIVALGLLVAATVYMSNRMARKAV